MRGRERSSGDQRANWRSECLEKPVVSTRFLSVIHTTCGTKDGNYVIIEPETKVRFFATFVCSSIGHIHHSTL